MDISRVSLIQSAIESMGGYALTPIKELLGEEYSFGEIKMVIAHLSLLKQPVKEEGFRI